jgi:hypothetical protein
MAILIECRDSPKFSKREATLHYWIKDALTSGDAAACVLAGAPSTFGALPRKDNQIRIEQMISLTDWDCTVEYGAQDEKEKEDQEFDFSFDFAATNAKMTHSYETIGKYAPDGQTAPDFGGAIGVTDNEVEGCDVIVPTAAFSEKWWFKQETVESGYKRTLLKLIGKQNKGTFRGWAPGEVLFSGASGSLNANLLWEISFKFLVSENVEDLEIDSITIPSKRGWDYVWTRYRPTLDAQAKVLVKKAISAYVERVYKEGDFDELGI